MMREYVDQAPFGIQKKRKVARRENGERFSAMDLRRLRTWRNEAAKAA